MNFFSFIQRASIEKVHSSAIAWLLSDFNTSFTSNEKKRLISCLAQSEVKGALISVHIEYYNIDILFEYEDVVIAIENKIKISEHSNQLKNYSETLLKHFPDKKIIKIFLSYANEKPSENDWIASSYEDLLTEIGKIEIKDKIILDYYCNLKELVDSKNSFLSDHQSYPSVFLDGNKKKHMKTSSLSNYARYISENGLETILQKAFFFKIKEQVLIDCVHCIISESRGNALLDFKNPLRCPSILFKGHNIDKEIQIDTGIQIQGSSIKVQFENGLDKDRNWKKKTSEFRNILKENIESIFKEIDDTNNIHQWRLNKPRSEQSNYYSISKKINLPKGSTGFHEVEFETLVNIIKNEIQICIELILTIENISKNSNLRPKI